MLKIHRRDIVIENMKVNSNSMATGVTFRRNNLLSDILCMYIRQKDTFIDIFNELVQINL